MTETEKLREALCDCLAELEAAVGMLYRGGLIHSKDIGKDKRDGFHALINGAGMVDVSRYNVNIKFPCRRTGCPHVACKTPEERAEHEDTCPYGEVDRERPITRFDKTKDWQGG